MWKREKKKIVHGTWSMLFQKTFSSHRNDVCGQNLENRNHA